MESTDQSVDRLEISPRIVGIDEESFAGFREKLSRKCSPRVGTECGNRDAGKEDGGDCCAYKGAPLIGGNKSHGEQYAELRFIGKASYKHPRQNGPALER